MKVRHLLASVFFLSSLASCNAAEKTKSFAFVLQADKLASQRGEALKILRASGRDILILDAKFGGEDGSSWSKSDIAALKKAQDGRIVLAYLSIGEAEDYRDYWDATWDANKDGKPDAGAPAFLCGLNPFTPRFNFL